MARITEKTLAQAQISAAPSELLRVPLDTSVVIRYIRIVNTTGFDTQFRLYLDPIGQSNWSDATCIMPYITLSGANVYSEPCWIAIAGPGQLGMEANAGNRLTITVWGAIVEQ